MFFRSNSTIRYKLTCLVVSCVLPVWLVAGFLVFHAYSTKRHQICKNMLESTRAMTMVVESTLKEGDEVIVEQIGGETKKKTGGSPMGRPF